MKTLVNILCSNYNYQLSFTVLNLPKRLNMDLWLKIFAILFSIIFIKAETDETGCPKQFRKLCNCGMGRHRYNSYEKDMQYIVNCTNSGFTDVSMLHYLPEK